MTRAERAAANKKQEALVQQALEARERRDGEVAAARRAGLVTGTGETAAPPVPEELQPEYQAVSRGVLAHKLGLGGK